MSGNATTNPVSVPPAAVETENLTRRFGTLTAVNDLSLAVPSGSIFALLGPNGAGKTTTIRMLTTMLTPTAGSARVAGLDVILQPRGVRKAIGYVSQMLSADGGLTGYENLLLFARIYGIPQRDRKFPRTLLWNNYSRQACARHARCAFYVRSSSAAWVGAAPG